jgi:hypothetical protein
MTVRNRIATWMLAGAGAACLGCSADGPPFGLDGDGGAPRVLRTPEEVVAAYAEALEARDFDTYASLLEPDPGPGRAEAGFRYYPLPEDIHAQGFPWIQGESWSRAEELGMIGHMMDSTFVSPVTGETVDSIDADIAILSTDEGDEGISVHAHAVLQVLWAAQSGARCDVRFDFLLVPDGRGNLTIREQREFRLNQRAIPRAEASSWGAIKSLYR